MDYTFIDWRSHVSFIVDLSVPVSLTLSIHLSFCLSISSLSISSVHSEIHLILCVCLSFCKSLYLSVNLFIYPPDLLCLSPSINLCICHICLSVHLSACFLSVCPSVFQALGVWKTIFSSPLLSPPLLPVLHSQTCILMLLLYYELLLNQFLQVWWIKLYVKEKNNLDIEC